MWECVIWTVSFHLSCLLLLRDAFVEGPEFLDMGAESSSFSEGLRPSLVGIGRGPEPGPDGAASWITMMSSLLCWPRCSLAKSNPFTVGACNWGQEQRGEKTGGMQPRMKESMKTCCTEVSLAVRKDKQYHIQNLPHFKKWIFWV